MFGAFLELVPATQTECFESQQNMLLMSSATLQRKLLAKDSHTCKDNLSERNEIQRKPPSVSVYEGVLTRWPHPNFSSQQRAKNLILKKGDFLSSPFKHLRMGQLLCPSLPLSIPSSSSTPFKEVVRSEGLLKVGIIIPVLLIVSPPRSKALKTFNLIPFLY